MSTGKALLTIIINLAIVLPLGSLFYELSGMGQYPYKETYFYVLSMLVFLVSLLPSVIAFSAWVVRIRKGKFIFEGENTSEITIETDYVSIQIRPESRKVYLTCKKKRDTKEFAFEDITGIISKRYERVGLLELFDLQLMDLLPSYRDTVEWRSIYLKTKTHKSICIFEVGQYKRREFLLDGYIKLGNYLLSRMGLYVDLKDYNSEARTKLRAIFTTAGCKI